jgi:alanyl aminopeptidase
VAPVSYRVELKLDPAKDDFDGFIRIKLAITHSTQTIWLNGTDIEVADALLRTSAKTYKAKATKSGTDFIGIEFESPVEPMAGELEIHYKAKLRLKDTSGVFRGEDNGNKYIFTQFEPIDARAAFPCFDEPSYKVPWQLTLHVPAQDTAISNTPIVHEEKNAETRTYTFNETKPLPSYLVAFAVGPFEYVDAGKAGSKHFPVRIVTPKGHAAEAQYAAEVTATILTRLEDYFGIPYPYDKSDNVAVPLLGGAMENPGMVTYGQTIILGASPHDTTLRQRGYVSMAAHELAHQWFGDLVTTAWWNDIWLNEAFATWMEDKLVADWKPEWRVRESQVRATTNVEREDAMPSARRIRQDIQSKDNISNAFDGITYTKGAAVIGMFESYVGREAFRAGLTSYLKQYAFRNSTAPEFLDAISSVTHKDITKAFSTFLNQTGIPLVSVDLDCTKGASVIHLEQTRFVPLGLKVSSEQTWQIPVCVRYGTGDESGRACTLLTQRRQDLVLKTAGCPGWVDANDDANGYYHVDYRGGLLASLTAGDVQKRLNSRERAELIGNALALEEAAILPASSALSLVEAFHDDPDRDVLNGAASLALLPEQHLIPVALRPKYQEFIRKNFAARAHALGWKPQAGEPDNVRLLRPWLLRLVAIDGGDTELASQASMLADGWLKDNSSLNPDLVANVLRTAAYYGDRNLFDRWVAEYKKTNDRADREQLLLALSQFHNADVIQAGKQMLLSGEIPFQEGAGSLLFSGAAFPETSHMPFEFVKAHYDEILAKRIGGVFDIGSFLPFVGTVLCDAKAEEEYKRFFEPRLDKLQGARYKYSETVEVIDSCIATKAAQAPGVEAFLAKY